MFQIHSEKASEQISKIETITLWSSTFLPFFADALQGPYFYSRENLTLQICHCSSIRPVQSFVFQRFSIISPHVHFTSHSFHPRFISPHIYIIKCVLD